MKIYIGADHQGASLASQLINYLQNQNFEVERSKLPNSPTDDYPDFAFDIANKVSKDKNSLGILICGNGIGISIAANKVKGIRCARVLSEEDAYKAKTHNGANIISFGSLDFEQAKQIVNIFISTNVVNEERHLRRVNKIIKYENGEYNEL